MTPINWERWTLYRDTIEACLREGYAPRGAYGAGSKGSAVEEAARRLMAEGHLRTATNLTAWVASQTKRAEVGKDHRLPRWDLFQSPALKRQAERGELGTGPVLPGFALKRTSTQRTADGAVEREWVQQAKAPGDVYAVEPGQRVKGVSTLVDADGRTIQQWIKTREDQLAPADLVAAFREAVQEITERAPALKAPKHVEDDLAVILPAPDLHLGLLAWGKESGQDWDLDIAQETILGAVARLMASTPPARQAVILGLGDLLHADGYDNATPKSKHALDVDSRYPKILKSAVRVMIAMIDNALQRHEEVLVRILPGNHDPESAIAVALALALYYESQPRVTVDDDPSYFWWWSWGTTLLGATHGDAAKMADLPLIMAARNPEAWGRSRFRHILTGHIHHRSAIELSGVTVESFQTPIASDAYHHKHGYGAGRSLSAITLHRDLGEIARNKVNVVG